MIEFNCPHCSYLIKAQTNAAGIRSKCPRCKANITVPMPEQSEPVFEEDGEIVDIRYEKNRPVAEGGSTWLKTALTVFACVFGFCFFASLVGALVSPERPRRAAEAEKSTVKKDQKTTVTKSAVPKVSTAAIEPDFKFVDRWYPDSTFINSVELWKKGSHHYLIHDLKAKKDDKWTQYVEVSNNGKRLTPNQTEYPGEYYLINSDGELESWDDSGMIGSPMSKSKKRSYGGIDISPPRKKGRTATVGEVARYVFGHGFCARSEALHTRMKQLLKAEDEAGLKEMLLDGKLIVVNFGTKVKVIDTGFFVFEVRILEGGNAGSSVFVDRAFLEKVE